MVTTSAANWSILWDNSFQVVLAESDDDQRVWNSWMRLVGLLEGVDGVGWFGDAFCEEGGLVRMDSY